ncbi:MAG: T9SS type A sorting domain-containing protein [Flavobacterium sp.]
MKRKLLFAALFVSGVAFAQQTHHVMWGIGENTAQFSPTIAPGDTVMWMWTTSHPHTVTSETGSAEAFNSGTLQGVGLSYSKTFTIVGANPYKCTFHGSMTGTITVDANAGTATNILKKFNVWPNPVNDLINVTAESSIERIEIYDMEGRKVMDTPNAGNAEAKIYADKLANGSYILKITSGGKQTSVAIVKK